LFKTSEGLLFIQEEEMGMDARVEAAAQHFIKKADLRIGDIVVSYDSMEDFMNAAAVELMRQHRDTVYRYAQVYLTRAETLEELAKFGDQLPNVIKHRAEYEVVGDITAEEARSQAEAARKEAECYTDQYGDLVDIVNFAKDATRRGV
jgi:negative regulator of genetic competence, sporulation and motility